MKLVDRLPYGFHQDEHENSKVVKFLDVEILKEYTDFDKQWIGKHKNVHVWWVLANGYAVGFNESPSRGWSFPTVKYSVDNIN